MDCGKDGLTFTQPSLVKPEFAAECDLKHIVKRFLRTGELPPAREGSSIDALHVPDDFQTVMDKVARTRQRFDRLPLEVRNRYNNDPEAWLADMAKTKLPETKLPETKPPETKPPETKPPETKPPETKA